MSATIISMPTTPTAAPGVRGIVRDLAQRTVNLLRAMKHRRDMNLLAAMDDRMLSDIGLTRGDVRDAISEPLWCDPTAVLVSRIAEKRRRRFSWTAQVRDVVEAPSLAPQQPEMIMAWPVHAKRYY